jgi:hypothetical protein
VLHKKTLIALAAAVALGCVPVATNALAAGHQNGGHGGGGQASAGRAGGGQSFAGRGGSGRAMAGPARSGRASAGYAGGGRVVRSGGYGGGYYGGGGGGYYGGGPVYDSCAGYDSGYGYNGCPGNGVPLVGAVINGVFGGYGGY